MVKKDFLRIFVDIKAVNDINKSENNSICTINYFGFIQGWPTESIPDVN